MSRRLLILRHAKSAWDTDASTDFERPLAKRGKRDAPRIGSWLHEQGLVPDYVVSSPAKRAEQTAIKTCRELGIKKEHLQWDERIYAASVEVLLGVLADAPKTAKTVMLVGHNPGLEDLTKYLGGDDVTVAGDGKLLPTATVANLEMPDNWSRLNEAAGRLVQITRPRTLDVD
jgi:phosphohistidine phosphatase